MLGEGLGCGELLGRALPLEEALASWLREADTVTLAERVGRPEAEVEGERLPEADWEGERLPVRLARALALWEQEWEELAEPEGVRDVLLEAERGSTAQGRERNKASQRRGGIAGMSH